MVRHNSLETYVSLFATMIADIADCYPDSVVALDLKKLRSRVAAEGISFLTKALPRLGKSFDRALQGDVVFDCRGFKTHDGVPKFLGFLFKRVFTPSGLLRANPCTSAIKHIRQILYVLYKIDIPHSAKTEKSVLDSFKMVEEELNSLSINPDCAIIRRARVIITRVLSGSCPRSITPKHGPGAVATGEKGPRKFNFSRIYSRLDAKYPVSEYFVTQSSQCAQRYANFECLESGTAKVVLVPKDSRGPRIISCEPLEYQWIQQGQQRKLYDIIESHPLTRGNVNFTSQEINRSLALSASRDGGRVTLDMKDASDRVSLQLVKELFRDSGWLEFLIASRSEFTRLPDGQTIKLNKFSPMGSAVCFPIEALVFFSLAVSCISYATSRPYREVCKRVFVYGDDIIVDKKDYQCLLDYFPTVGLMFNKGKCCVQGSFRESCGCDAFLGVDVTPIRLRRQWSHRKDASQLQSYVAFSNAMDARGYYRTAESIRQLVESVYGTLPFVDYDIGVTGSLTPTTRVIGWYRPYVGTIFANNYLGQRLRFSKTLHRMEVYGYVSTPTKKISKVDADSALLNSLCSISTVSSTGIYAVPRCNRITRSWGALNV